MAGYQVLSNFGYDRNALYSADFLRRLVSQILSECQYDRSSTLTRWHIAKAFCSIATKESRSQNRVNYASVKQALWKQIAGIEYTKPTQSQRDQRDLYYAELHQQSSSYLYRSGGYHEEIENNSLTDVTPVDAEAARQARKLRRIQDKLQNHGVVVMLGPTGSGKTHRGLEYAESKFGKDTVKEGVHIFRATVGEGYDPAHLLGCQRVDKSKMTVAWEDGVLTQWAKGKVEGRLLQIDEFTSQETLTVLENFLKTGIVVINGEQILPEGNPVIILTGNESKGGKYEGRYPIESFIRQHAVVTHKPSLTERELDTLILAPCFTGLEGSAQMILSTGLIEGYQALEELGVSAEVFGTRELQDAAALTRLYYQQSNTENFTREDYRQMGLTAIHRCLSQRVSSQILTNWVDKLRVTDLANPICPDGSHETQWIAERQALIIQNMAAYGAKVGVIVDH